MYMDHPPEKWEPTLQLRWAKVWVGDHGQGMASKGPPKLQQAFKLTAGKPEDLNKIEWRDVPTVDVTK